MSFYSDLLYSVREVTSSEFILRETDEQPLPSSLPNELHLQALWFAGQLGRKFETVDGREVNIIQFGHWNHSAGPDFCHASVEVGGEVLSGDIELEMRASDWEQHGHRENEAFNAVVLHVVFSEEVTRSFTRTSDQKNVARVEISPKMLQDVLQLPLLKVADAHLGRCAMPLAQMSADNLEYLMLEAVRHRVKIKAKKRRRMLDVLGEDEWLWQVLAETLGYRPNRLAMTLLSQRLPLSELKGHLESAEAILFGAAGFITARDYELAPEESQEYLRTLWDDWWQVRGKYEPVPERKIVWNFSGIRPVNHPLRRIGCLAEVLKHWRVFKRCLVNADELMDYFDRLTHLYWSWHYTLKSKRSSRKMSLMGKERVNDFLMNHILPELLNKKDKPAWERYLEISAPVLSEKVKLASLRLFGESHQQKKYLKKAWQHQALLQIYQDFCLHDVTDCKDCVFPEQLKQWSL